MARIRVALELAAEGDLEKARRHLAGIGADLDELDRLVEDVLAAARLDRMAGSLGGSALPLERAPVDVKELVSDTVDRFQERNPNRTVEVSLPDDLASVVLLGDSTLLRRLLANLLDNAGKYSEPETPITLRVLRAKEEVSIEVSDDGIGIDPEDLPRLFTPFFRTDRSRARGTGGTGLGLALVKRIAEAHGGTVAAESEVGKGTVFRVRLPVRPG
jgi:signal transduction histidine kinase